MKVSVIIPVKNEESTIRDLLDGLLIQTKKPDEIVITDGGSIDKTREIIDEYSKKNNELIKLICLPQSLPGKGRNTSIEHASYNIIASIDAGCKPDKEWLRELMVIFEKASVDVVFGLCKPVGKTILEKCIIASIIPTDNWLSVASMAFKKNIWEKVSGFPEDLRTAEDEIFIKRIRNLNCKISYNNKAIVFWRVRSTLQSFFIQYFQYSRGKGRVKSDYHFYLRKIIFYSLLLSIFFVGTISHSIYYLLITALMFFVWGALSILKHRSNFTPIKNIFLSYLLLPFVILIRDFAAIAGFILGIIERSVNCQFRGM